jgi:hypothetical protein
MEMSEYATIVSLKGLTIYGEGEQITIPADKPDYDRAVELLKVGRAAEAFALATKYKAALNPAIKAVFGDVEVTYVHGELVINNHVGGTEIISGEISERIGSFIERKIPPHALMAFVARVQKNPSYRARHDLFAWVDKNNMPITADGCFIAFKIVKNDYWDIYTGNTFYHKPGSVIEMDRSGVDDNPNNTCSAGAHFCGEGYLPHYGTSRGDRIVVLKIAPEDVVAFPTDYNLAKGRAYKYQVIDEMKREDVAKFLGTIDRSYFDDSSDDDDHETQF